MRALLLTLVVLVVAACGSGEPTPTEPVDARPPATSPLDVGVIDDPGETVFRVREIGPGGQVPEEVVIQLHRDLFGADQVGLPAPDGNVVEIEPALAGQLRVTDANALSWVPEGAFRPGTHYRFVVKALSDGSTTLAPPAEGVWSREFDTVPFAFERMELRDRDLKQNRLEVDLVFTAPVEPAEVRSRASFNVGNKAVQPVGWGAGRRANEVRVSFSGAWVWADASLGFSLREGVPYALDAAFKAPVGEGALDLKAGKPVEIHAVLVREGASGHYLEVICDDDAVGDERWWWDPDTYDGWWVSSRCMLSEDEARASLHLSPDVTLSIAEGPAGFRIFGDFGYRDYDFTLDAGTTTIDGGVLGAIYETTLAVPHRSPQLGFATRGRYLPRSAWKNLAVRHMNLDRATLTVRHVPPENLVFWLGGDEPATERTSNVVLKKDLPLSGATDAQETTWLDVAGMLPAVGRGVYELHLSNDEANVHAYSRILLTDMQIVAKRAAPREAGGWTPEVLVWALDVHSGDLLSGVDVKLVRPSGKTLGECRTGIMGNCRLDVPPDETDPAGPFALIASRDDDLTYLKFDELRIDPEGDVQGEPWTSAEGEAAYKAATWTDRGVYRPGETAHVGALVRDASFLAPPQGLPVVMKLYDPRGKELRQKVLSTDVAGLVVHDFDFADFATTGRYRVAVQVAEREVGQASLNVEEFVPERMKVEARAEGEGYLLSEAVPVEVGARWLFGGSAEDSRMEVRCQVRPAPFTPPTNAEFHYGLTEEGGTRNRPVETGTVTGRLDAEGKATVLCPSSDRAGGVLGSARLAAQVSVFEGDSGRTTTATASVPMHPDRYYLGTRSSVSEVEAGKPVSVEGIVVDWTGRPLAAGAPAQVDVRIYRLEQEYGWFWDEWEGDNHYQRTLRRAQEDRFTAKVEGSRFKVAFTPGSDAAGYVVAVSAGNARTEQFFEGTDRDWWWYPGDSVVDSTPRPDKPRTIALAVPEVVAVGGKVEVTATAPFAGQLLFTAETDRVLGFEWKEVQAGPVTWTFPVREFVPNVYVSAFLVKDPHLESADAFLPDRAFGVKSVRIEPTAFTQKVTLTVPEVVRPYSKLEIALDVKATDGSKGSPGVATVAVVDEGILQLTSFETPDPAAQVFARRALGVDSFETVGWTLLMPPAGPSSRTGGDGMGEAGGRVQMVKPVALWSGPVAIPESGKAKVEVEIPGYRGQLRVMAVTATEDRLGSAQASVTVRDPLVLQTTLPRFLVAGDIAQIPVFVSNMSGQDRDVTIRLEVEEIGAASPGDKLGKDAPVVEFLGEQQGNLALKDGASGTVAFQVTANRVPGAARFRVLASSGDLVSKEELDLPLVPAQPEARSTERVALTGGSADLDPYLDGWLPGSDHTTFWVTTNPYAPALTHLRYLLRYPYGCIEQTTSSTRPLLYVSTLLDGIDPTLAANASVDDMVAKGIERVMSMQTPSGGFAYWPGGSSPTTWGTAYASHMLLDAKEAGYAVPDKALADAIAYLDREVGGRSGLADGTAAYGHYVLARAGKGRAAAVARLIDHLDGQARTDRYWEEHRKSEHRYLLMAALYLAGDHRYEAELKSPDTGPLTKQREYDWSFYSDLRKRGLQLAVFQDLFGTDPAGESLAQLVSDAVSREPSRYYTTQELSWAVTGLGKRVLQSAAALDAATLTVDGTARKPLKEGGKGPGFVWSLARASLAQDLRVAVPSAPAGGAWVVMTTEGVRAVDDLPYGGQGLAVARSVLAADGEAVDPANQNLGDAVFVQLEIQNTSARDLTNVALVDRIPAGWEIENPRLGRGSLPEWVDEWELWQVDHMNVRDDRIEAFGSLEAGETRRVVYAVRAVTAGTFTEPDVSAEAMYDPDVWARQRGEVITVRGPWQGFLL